MLYVLIACLAIIVLQVLEKTQIAMVVSCSVCLLLVIYWIAYFIIAKKF